MCDRLLINFVSNPICSFVGTYFSLVGPSLMGMDGEGMGNGWGLPTTRRTFAGLSAARFHETSDFGDFSIWGVA